MKLTIFSQKVQYVFIERELDLCASSDQQSEEHELKQYALYLKLIALYNRLKFEAEVCTCTNIAPLVA